MSPDSRIEWLETLKNLAYDLTLYSPNTSLHDAMRWTPAEAKDFFESNSFKKYAENKRQEQQNVVEMVNRLNSVIQGLNNVVKAVQPRKER